MQDYKVETLGMWLGLACLQTQQSFPLTTLPSNWRAIPTIWFALSVFLLRDFFA